MWTGVVGAGIVWADVLGAGGHSWGGHGMVGSPGVLADIVRVERSGTVEGISLLGQTSCGAIGYSQGGALRDTVGHICRGERCIVSVCGGGSPSLRRLRLLLQRLHPLPGSMTSQ